MNKEIERVLEEQFPKGSRERGGALVLHAVAQIELEKAVEAEKGKTPINNDIETIKEKMTAYFEDKFNQFLPVSKYGAGAIVKGNEIGMMYNCSIIFNPTYHDRSLD